MLRATPGAAWPHVANARDFDAPPPATHVKAPSSSVVYSFGETAGLVLDQGGQRNLTLWDPVPFFDYWYRPLKDLLNGDPTPYAVVAATLNQQLAKAGAFRAVEVDVAQSGTVSAWVGEGGKVRLLAGNLEEGLREDGDRSRRMTLSLPKSWHGCRWQAVGGVAPTAVGAAQTRIDLLPQGSVLLLCDR